MIRSSLGRTFSLRLLARGSRFSSNAKPVTTSQSSHGNTDSRPSGNVAVATGFERKLLLLTRAYKWGADIPEYVPSSQIRRSKNILRAIIGSLLSILIIHLLPVYIASEHKEKSGDSIAKQKRQYMQEIQAKKLQNSESNTMTPSQES